jgi:endonuclease YncB( thermonuclease family)
MSYRSWERRSRTRQVIILAVLVAVGLYLAGVREVPFIENEDASAVGAGNVSDPPSSTSLVVSRVVDGDTLRLSDGRTIRLAQIDAAERAECYSDEATDALAQITSPGATPVRFEGDAAVGTEDRYGRSLGYLFVGKRNVNLELVRAGAASVWYFDGQRGRYAAALLEAAEEARASGAGLWGVCPGARLDPTKSLSSG